MNSKQKIMLFILSALNFTHILDFMIMMPLGNYLMPYFHINPHQFSLLVAAYTLSAGAAGFIAAFFVDGFDRKKILLFGYTGFLVGTFACGMAPSYHLLLAARVLAGIFGGLIGAQVLAIVADIFTYEKRGQAMGAIMSAFAIASTLGVPFALYLANLFSWHAPFLLVAALGSVIVPLIVKYIPSQNKHIIEKQQGQRKIDALLHVVKEPLQRRALLFSGLIMTGHFMIIPFINPYMEFNRGYSKFQTPMVYLVGGIASFFAANLLGKLSDNYGKLKVFLICVFTSLIFVYIITNMPQVPFAVVLSFFGVWFVLSTGRTVTAQAMISNVVKQEQRGSFMSFNSSVQQLGTSAASLIAGFVVIKGADEKIQHYNYLGFISIGVLVAAALLAGYIFKGFDKRGVG
jgi:MFS transporter, DHA1 family, inner membrane transport protein